MSEKQFNVVRCLFMLQHIVERARGQGFCNFVFCVNYHAEMIQEFFGNGRQLGVSIEYVQENKPLGTAGALSLIETKPHSNFSRGVWHLRQSRLCRP